MRVCDQFSCMSTNITTTVIVIMTAIICSICLMLFLVNGSNGVAMIPSVELIDGHKMPMIGLGTYRITDNSTAQRIVEEAIEVGYRHIDTAYHYQNERFIGQKLNELFDANVIKREDIFITTKLWNTFHKRESVIKGLNESLEALGLKQLDLALIHFPLAFKEDTGEYIPVNSEGLTLDLNIDVSETWKGMEDALRAGLTKSIGVSNFNITQIERILRKGSIKPVVNQVEIHPYLTQVPLVDYCKSNGINLVAYSPLAKANQTLFNEDLLKQLAQKYQKTVAQVIMRWLLQRDIIVIPKTTKKERLIENMDIFDFQLNDVEMKQIFALNKDYRITRFENARYNPNYPYEWPFERKVDMQNMPYPLIKLNNGNLIPQIGFGTWKMEDPIARRAVKDAISVGYRHIDTAWRYKNEKGVGQGLKDAFNEKMVKREDIFLTTKVWNTFHGRELPIKAINESLTNLGLPFVDLALIHWPTGFKSGTGEEYPRYSNESIIPYQTPDQSIEETWKGMEDIYKMGLAKNIGVSNFNIKHLERLLKIASIKPVVNQIEIHPFLVQSALVNFCQSHEIAVTAYSPLRQADKQLLENPILLEIGDKYKKSAAQVALRWQIERGIIIIPKTSHKQRMTENFNIFDFKLTNDEVAIISSLNSNTRLIDIPGNKDHPDYPFNY